MGECLYAVHPATSVERVHMDAIEAMLESIKWPARVTRRNIGTAPNRRAFVLGKVRKLDVVDRLVESRYNKVFPELYAQLRELVQMHDPDFTYNAIQLNRNVHTDPHRDMNNYGPSYCLALGTFTGGGLDIYPDNCTAARPDTVDNHRTWVLYDGHKVLHGSAPVTSGTRYALIFYTTLSRKQDASLRRRGMR